uniref:Protein pim1 n=1 Tax=Panagrellus redivivus TaxID=6233 RepID=A0A7E4UQR8_PANRE
MSAVEEPVQRMDVDEHRESEEQNEGRQSEDNADELILEEDPNATAEQIESAQKDDPVPEPEHENDESEEQNEDAETGEDENEDAAMEEDAPAEESSTRRSSRRAAAAAPAKKPPPKKAPPKTKAKPAAAAKSPKATTPKKAETAAKASKTTTPKKAAAEPAAKRGSKTKTPTKPAVEEKEKPTRSSGRTKAATTAAAKTATPAKKAEPATPSKARGGGRKRKVSEAEAGETSTAVKRTKSEKGIKPRFLSIEKFQPSVLGVRVLTCGEGEQLGHPGRTTTRKPRAVDTLPEGISIRQVVAGGVHTVVLTDDYVVYSCGINEGGTVPVKGLASEETTDELTIIEFPPEIEKEGRIVQLTTGAGFTAALTEKGSVIAWGNLRDDNGAVDVHHLFANMRKGPTVIIHHTNVVIVKIKAGENHLVMLSEDGEVYTFGEGSHGQLGSSARTKHIRSGYMADDKAKNLRRPVLEKNKFLKFTDIFAGGFWTMARAEDGRIFVCGLNNYGQLGIPLPADLKSEGAEGDDLEEQNRRLIVDRLIPSPAFSADKKWTHIGGVKHTIARNDDGEVYGMGLNTDNELGLGTYQGKDDQEHWRYLTHQRIELPEGVKIAGIAATLGATIAWTETGDAYAFGYDSVGQLGLGIKDDEDKSVSKPTKISSAHLEGFKIVSVSIADNHAVFLAAKSDSGDADETPE